MTKSKKEIAKALDQSTGRKHVRVLACQINIPTTSTVHDRDKHLEQSARLVNEQLKRQSAELVVLPELSSIDYSRQSFENLSALAELDEGPSFECWSKVARE